MTQSQNQLGKTHQKELTQPLFSAIDEAIA